MAIKALRNSGNGFALDEKGKVVLKSLAIRLEAGDLSGTTEKSMAVKLPAKSIVTEVYLNVITAATGTTKTLDIGTLSSESGGDADALAADVSVAATGIVVVTLAAPVVNVLEHNISATAGSALGALVADIIIIYKEITA